MPRAGAGGRDSILLIEDDRDLRETLAELLTDVGHSVFLAKDGREALQMLDSAAIPRPCLVLLDWLMRGMSGPEFLTAIQLRPDVAALRVLVISGASNLEQASSYPGVVGVLRKPFQVDDLLAVTRTHCATDTPHLALG
jgi:CheY-like chemotaxis protein